MNLLPDWRMCDIDTSGAGTVNINDYILETQASGTDRARAWYYIPIRENDTVEVTADVRVESGVVGMGIDFLNGEGKTLANWNLGNTLIINPTMAPVYRSFRIISTAPRWASFARINFGLWTDIEGHGFFKNPRVISSAPTSAAHPKMGYGLIRRDKTPGSWSVYDKHVSNSVIKAVQWNDSEKALCLTLSHEFSMPTGSNQPFPLVFCAPAGDHGTNQKALPKAFYNTNDNHFYVCWVDVTTGDRVDVEADSSNKYYAYVFIIG